MHSPWAWKIILDARDAGLGADFIFVAAGRSPDPERGDNFVSDLNRDRSRKQCNVGQRPERWTGRIFGGKRCKRARSLNLKIGPKVTTVYALRKADVVVRMVEWSPFASSLMTPEVSTTTAETG
jgi:hypothetical protein